MKNSNSKIYVSSIFYFLIISSIQAQTFCNTSDESPTDDNFINIGIDGEPLNSVMNRTNTSSYNIRVYMHVIRRSNGTGGQSVSNVHEGFTILNQDFNPHDISFVWDNNIDYIDEDDY